MNRKNKRRRRLMMAIGPAVSLLLAGYAAAQEDCASSGCHASLLAGEHVHPVAEGCTMCHQPSGEQHPKKGRTGFTLTQEPPDLCYSCHDAFGKKSHVHAPVEGGMCTTCHDPHASNQPKMLTQPVGELCGMCHADHTVFEVVHGPVSAGGCTACHTPHESVTENLLLAEGQDLCFGCHLDVKETVAKKNVHPALAGGCTSCHNPHGSEYDKLLAADGQDLCFMCHAEIQERVTESPVVHAALYMGTGCPSCHSPHASDNPRLLLQPQKTTCLGCHDDLIPEDAVVQHGPINDGKCTACHEPHAGQNVKLLREPFPSEAYVPYTDQAYPLCFICHKRDLLAYPDTSFATGFRDGERNLHYLHVHKEKGRSCRLCHTIHASSNERLIARTVSFGKWRLPLKYVKTATGGGCSPGCHKPQSYDRESPGRKPKPPAG